MRILDSVGCRKSRDLHANFLANSKVAAAFEQENQLGLLETLRRHFDQSSLGEQRVMCVMRVVLSGNGSSVSSGPFVWSWRLPSVVVSSSLACWLVWSGRGCCLLSLLGTACCGCCLSCGCCLCMAVVLVESYSLCLSCRVGRINTICAPSIIFLLFVVSLVLFPSCSVTTLLSVVVSYVSSGAVCRVGLSCGNQ